MAGGGSGASMRGRSFLDLSDAGGDAIAAMIGDAQDRKAARFDSSGRGRAGPRAGPMPMLRWRGMCWG